MVNPDVDGYTITVKHQKTLRKAHLRLLHHWFSVSYATGHHILNPGILTWVTVTRVI